MCNCGGGSTRSRQARYSGIQQGTVTKTSQIQKTNVLIPLQPRPSQVRYASLETNQLIHASEIQIENSESQKDVIETEEVNSEVSIDEGDQTL